MSTTRIRRRPSFRAASARSTAPIAWGLWALALLLPTATPAGLGAQAPALTVDDLRLEVGLSGPEVSPDGRRAVVVTSRPDYEENRFERSLVLVDLGTGERRDLTPQRRGSANPAGLRPATRLRLPTALPTKAHRSSSSP
jgi:hypothetical protein